MPFLFVQSHWNISTNFLTNQVLITLCFLTLCRVFKWKFQCVRECFIQAFFYLCGLESKTSDDDIYVFRWRNTSESFRTDRPCESIADSRINPADGGVLFFRSAFYFVSALPLAREKKRRSRCTQFVWVLVFYGLERH